MDLELEDVLQQVLDSRLADLHTSMPGLVVAFHGDTTPPTADVRPVLRRAIPDLDGATQYEELPVIPSVPVDYPCGLGGTVAIVWPLSPGDTVQLHFPERDTAEWMASGVVESPREERMHTLSAARCYPAGGHHGQPLPGGVPAGQLTITAPLLALGGSGASDFVALAGLVTAALNTLKTAIGAAPTTPGDGGATFKAALVSALASWPPTLAATKVKAL